MGTLIGPTFHPWCTELHTYSLRIRGKWAGGEDNFFLIQLFKLSGSVLKRWFGQDWVEHSDPIHQNGHIKEQMLAANW